MELRWRALPAGSAINSHLPSTLLAYQQISSFSGDLGEMPGRSGSVVPFNQNYKLWKNCFICDKILLLK